jgi:hypothetical protein
MRQELRLDMRWTETLALQAPQDEGSIGCTANLVRARRIGGLLQ